MHQQQAGLCVRATAHVQALPRLAMALFSAVMLASFWMVGCCDAEACHVHRVESQAEAGSTHLAVTSVGAWHEFAGALQPVFSLTADQAKDQVAPTTLRVETRIRDTAGAAIRIAPPTSSTTSTTTSTETAGQGAAMTAQQTRSIGPGDVSNVPGGALESPSGGAADLPLATAPDSSALDPLLRYRTGAALFEEVQLLNRAVRHAALRAHAVPYVVRLQMTVMPRARDMPYDAYADLSFFFKDPDTSLQSSPGCATPTVVPLLVTDALEQASVASTAATTRQVAFGLLAMYEGFGGSAELSKARDTLRSLAGRDLNSLFTIGRITDNTVRVRFGASNRATSRYALEPQAYNVTVLLLAPQCSLRGRAAGAPWRGKVPSRAVRVFSETTFVDVASGVALRPRATPEIEQAMDQLAKQDGLAIPGRDLAKLIGLLQTNDYVGFLSAAEPLTHGLLSPNNLWVQLTELLVGGRFQAATFELPTVQSPRINPPAGLALFDDGKTEATLTLEGDGLTPDVVHATLRMVDARKPDAGSFSVSTTKVEAADDGTSVRIAFPSLRAWNIVPTHMQLEVGIEASGLYPPTDSSIAPEVSTRTFPVVGSFVHVDQPPTPAFTMSTATKTLVLKDGTASVMLHLKLQGPAVTAKIQVVGAELRGAAGNKAGVVTRLEGNEFDVGQSGDVTLSLANVKQKSDVRIEGEDNLKISHSPLVLTAE